MHDEEHSGEQLARVRQVREIGAREALGARVALAALEKRPQVARPPMRIDSHNGNRYVLLLSLFTTVLYIVYSTYGLSRTTSIY